MNNKKRFLNQSIWFVIIVLIVFSSNNAEINPNSNLDLVVDVDSRIKSANNLPKIQIDGNSQLDDFENKTGLGSIDNPYIIENYTIDAGNIGSAVSIQNTDRYVVLSNLTVTNSAGYGTGSGIYFKNVTNGQIELCQTPSNYHGLYFDSCNNISITYNNVSDCIYGVRLDDSHNATLTDNNLTGCGLYLEGDLDSQVSHTSSNNLVNNQPLYWYVNETDLDAVNFTSAGQVVLVNCNDTIISDLNVSAATVGLHLLSTNDCVITNVTSDDGVYGFHFDSESRNNTATNCHTSRNRFYGQFLDSSNTTIVNCTATFNNFYGFLLDFPGEFNQIVNSTASNNSDDGIRISNSANNTIDNCTMTGNSDYGIQIFSSEDNTVEDCTISGNTKEGLYLRNSDLNIINNCSISGNTDDGVYLEDSHNNNLTGCTTSGNSYYGMYLDNSNSNDIEKCIIFDNTNGGLVLSSSGGNTILNCSTWNNQYGYFLYDSSYNTITNCSTINSLLHGFYLYYFSQHNTLFNCTANASAMTGIRVQYATNWNTIMNCTSSNNQYGLSIDESYYNDITQNELSLNEYGVYLINSAFDNVFWKNKILNNSFHQALDNSGTNQWNFSGHGNFWSDYRIRYPSAIDLGGYWNIPYSINGSAGAQDNYPLVITIGIPESDNEKPSWVEMPENQVIEYGEPFNYELNATDNIAVDECWINDTTYFQIDENGIITNTQQLFLGSYSLEIFVNDTSNNTISAVIEITCVDTESPLWIETPQNQIVEYGISFMYDVNATDNIAVDEYWINYTTHFQINSQGVITNTTVLDSGTYTLSLRVYDSSGNYITAEITITIEP
ncbi:MAG: right-handed parallel beta-helix repeat-containing protein, partial [Promethearchaeota archaeon]